MDAVDVALSLMLLQDSRTPYRVLAERLNLSVNAVHKRIQGMIEAGMMRGFTARADLRVTGALNVYIYGFATAEPLRDLPAKLSENDSVYWVTQAGGGYTYVGAYVKSLGDLSSVGDFVRNTAEISEPRVGIIDSGQETYPPPKEVLDQLDWQIIYNLQENSRRPLAEIAQDLGVSAKTVRRRLDRMMDQHLIDLSMRWYPDASNDIICVFYTKPALGKRADFNNVKRAYAPSLLYSVSFSNIPAENLLFAWTRTMKELKELKGRIEAEPSYKSVSMNILYTGDIFPTWRDKLPHKMGWPDQST